jgi:hypothetical protein
LALWLHIVNAVLRGEQPSQVIGGETMEKAILQGRRCANELSAYYLWQHRLIHTHNSPESGLAAIGLKIQKFAERVGEVTASRLKSGIRALRKIATDQIRQLMQTLANAGYGSVQGEGAEMIYKAALGDQQLQLDLSDSANPKEIDAVDPPLMELSVSEIQTGQESQAFIDTIDALPACTTDLQKEIVVNSSGESNSALLSTQSSEAETEEQKPTSITKGTSSFSDRADVTT